MIKTIPMWNRLLIALVYISIFVFIYIGWYKIAYAMAVIHLSDVVLIVWALKGYDISKGKLDKERAQILKEGVIK